MSRRPNPLRPVKLTLMLPEDVRARLDLHLWSDLEGRVPKGRYQEFFLARISEHFDGGARLDLERFGFPPGYFVRGPKEMLEALALSLELRKDSE